MAAALTSRSASQSWLDRLTESPALIFGVLLLVAVLPVVVFTIHADRVFVQEAISDQLAESRNVTNLASVLVEEHFSQNVALLSSYATDPELKHMWKRRDMKGIQEHMDRALSLQPDAALMSIYDLEGTMRARAPEEAELIGQNFAHRDWYKGVVARWRPYVSEVYRTRAAHQQLAVAIAVPVKDDDGKPIGIIAAAYSLQRVSSWLPNSKERTITVVDQRGKLLATPGIDVFAPLVDLSKHEAVKRVLAGEEGADEFGKQNGGAKNPKNPHKGPFYISYKPLRTLGWGVLTYQPSSSVAAHASGIRRQNIFFSAVVMGLVVISGLFILILSRRKQTLAAELRALSESEERYRSLIQNAIYGMARASEKGFISVNPALVKMLGYESEDELLRVDPGKDLYANPEVRKQLYEKYKSGTPIVMEDILLKRKDGTAIAVRLSGKATRDEKGELIIEAIAEDVTERRALENQLRQSQKMDAIGRLAGGVAHDFNNLLTVIAGYTDLAADALGTQHPLRKELDEVKKATARATSLTRQLLAFSRQQMLEPRLLDINASVRGLENMLRRTLGENIELAIKLSPNSATIKADPGQIDQVILNLVLNARDAMPDKGGRISIETAIVELDANYAREHLGVQPGRYVMLAVSDTGAGMDPETQTHVFEPFFTTKTSDRGTGLGLSTVYGIIKQSGGHVWLYSERGVGTAFKVYLPLAPAAAGSTAVSNQNTTFSPSSGTVLLVEDEDAVRELTRQSLARAGYRVLTASAASDALRLAHEHANEIDLLLTDVVLKKINGRELAQQITTAWPHIRVLYMSGYTDDAILHYGVVSAGAHFLQKPFTTEGLLRKVREVIHAPAQRLS